MKRKRKPAPARHRLRGPIHTRISELRKLKELTLEQLADVLGIDKTAVWHWENGDSRPSADKLPELAATLGTTVAELIEGDAGYKALSQMLEAAAS